MAVTLGQCDIEVSRISLGTVKLGRNTDVKYPFPFEVPDDYVVSSLLAEAAAMGINLLDTAPAYGNSEQRIGQLLPGHRSDWIICTKAGEHYDQGRSTFDFSGAAIAASVEQSLRNLRTEYLDIVLLHSNGDDLHILNETDALPTLAALKEKGDIRYFGISTKTVAGGLAAVSSCDVLMLTLNLEDQSNLEVLKQARKHGTGILLKKVLASGQGAINENLLFALSQEGVHSAVVGTIDNSHLRENVAIAARLG